MLAVCICKVSVFFCMKYIVCMICGLIWYNISIFVFVILWFILSLIEKFSNIRAFSHRNLGQNYSPHCDSPIAKANNASFSPVL